MLTKYRKFEAMWARSIVWLDKFLWRLKGRGSDETGETLDPIDIEHDRDDISLIYRIYLYRVLKNIKPSSLI